MASVTLATLRAKVARRGSYENSRDISTALLNDFINEAAAEVWDLLVGAWEDYQLARGTITTTPGDADYLLATDFYKLRKVSIADTTSPSGYRRLLPFDLQAEHTFSPNVVGKRYRYRIESTRLLVLAPAPVAVETLLVHYVPQCPELVNDADTFDAFNGYDRLVLQLALRRCQERQDQPTDSTDREIARLTQQIQARASARDADEPFYLNARGPAGDDGYDEWEVV